MVTVVATAATSACSGAGGGGIPGDSIATVDGKPITKQAYRHWLTVTAAATNAPDPADAPRFAKCIAAKRKAADNIKGLNMSDAALKGQCRDALDGARTDVMRFLVRSAWFEDEAAKRGVHVSDADVQKEFEAKKQRSFPKAGQYEAYLATTGISNADMLALERTDAIVKRVYATVADRAAKVSDAEARTYYDRNRANLYDSPPSVDLRVVLTRDRAGAVAARRALDRGKPWAYVAKRYSIDRSSNGRGGLIEGLPAAARGSRAVSPTGASIPKALAANLGAVGRLAGPLKTPSGYYVYKVVRSRPAEQKTFSAVKPDITKTLARTNEQRAISAFEKRLVREWRSKTYCRVGYATADCTNGPRP